MLDHRLDEQPVVAKHVEQWGPESVRKLVVPILIPRGWVERVGRWMKPSKIFVARNPNGRLSGSLCTRKQLLQGGENGGQT